MAKKMREDLRNLAIIAHVDHGKTSLVDSMLWQGEIFNELDYHPERVRDALNPAREKTLSVMPKIVSLFFRGTRVNLVDVPGHADFGGEVERTLKLVDGVLLLVDAVEGPLPQTRYVLRKALEAGLASVVVVNKIDLPQARPAEVVEETRGLFSDLDAGDEQCRFPVLYTDARQGRCRVTPDGDDQSLMPVFEEILRSIPAPTYDPEGPMQLLVTSLDYDDYLGRMALGRVFNGRLCRGQEVAHCRLDGDVVQSRVTGVFGYEGLRRIEGESAQPGAIVSVTGLESVQVGESLCDPDDPRPLPPIKVDEPTLALTLSVNDSPMAGFDGQHVTGPKLRERLWKEILTNVAIRVEETDSPDAFRLCGRGELQLAILLEMLRREGFEMLVGRPEILTRTVDGETHEPMELLVADCPEPSVGVVTEKVAARRGRMMKMVNHGTGRVRLEFRVPSRGLIGFRTEFLADTKGAGIMNHLFDGYDVWQGPIAHRSTGSLIADRPGRATARAIEHTQPRGTIFVAPDDQVYEGMIVGENAHADDVEVNIVKTKRPDVESVPAERRTLRLVPPRTMSLEQCLEFVAEDECVEVTPKSLRLRKRVLPSAARSR